MDLLLAVQRNQGVREVRLERAAQQKLATGFDELAASFLNANTEVSDYVPNFRPEDEGVQRVKYSLPAFLWQCHASLPNGVQPLSKGDLTDAPPIALVSVNTGKAPVYCFQAIDSRNTLRPGWAVFFNPNGFKLQQEIGVIVPERLDALHKGGWLYFRSEYVVRRFLDLEKFFRAATDQEIETLFAAEAFVVDDWDELKNAATEPLRRKLNAVLGSGRTFTPTLVQQVAKRIGRTVRIRNGAVVVPTDRSAFRDFVRIIDDDFLQSMLEDDRVYLTTSKRPIPGRGGR